MTLLFLLTLRMLLATPAEAVRMVVREEQADAALLMRLCVMESLCHMVGVHREVRPMTPRRRAHRAYRRAVEHGDLHPERCEHHQQVEDSERWGVRGPWGLFAALHLHHLREQPCAAPEALDLAIPAARVAARHIRRLEAIVGRDPERVVMAWRVGVGAVLRGQ